MLNSNRLENIRGNLTAELAEWPVNNISVAFVSFKNSMWEELFLYGDLEKEYYLASVTKVLSTYGILYACKQKLLGLDDVIVSNGAGVKHFLSHASGLGPVNSTDFIIEPAKKRIYSNYGFEILSEYFEHKTKVDFSQYLKEQIFSSLDMDHTYLTGPAGYAGYTNLNDMCGFLHELINPGLISQEELDMTTTPIFPNLRGILPGFGSFKENVWGLGFEIKGDKHPHWTSPLVSSQTYGHFGQSGCYLWVDPQAKLGMVVLADKDFGEWSKELWPKFNTMAYKIAVETESI